MKGFNNEMMFVKAKVMNNDCWFVTWIIEIIFRTTIGPEKFKSARSNTLTDFIDFDNFFFLFFKTLSEIVEFFTFKESF